MRLRNVLLGPGLWALRSKRNFLVFYAAIIFVTSAVVVLPKVAPNYPPTPKAAFGFVLMIFWAAACCFAGAYAIWLVWGKSHQLPKPPLTE